ncbi:MAG: acyltransferase family protein [Lachnospiraceae bacterium]|nr:acyltransferase family protein [Lachnospiraceae bacterium]
MKQRNHYLDVLRVLACFLIVGVHVSAFNIDDQQLGSFNFLITNAYDCLSIIGVPLFVMISGALLLNPDYEISLSKLLGNKCLRLLTAYFGWLLFYNIINCYQEGYGYSWMSVKHNVFLETLLGRGIYHLWFLPMLAGLYLILPFLKSFAKDKKLCEYFLILYTVIVIVLPTLLKFNFRFKTIVSSLYERIPFVMITGYVGYFVLGHYLHYFVKKLSGKQIISISLIGLIAFNIGHLICFQDSIRQGELSTILNDPYALNDYLSAIAIFLLVKQFGDSRPHPKAAWFARYTFGVYLAHPFFLMVTGWFGLNTLFLPALFSIPICVVLVVVASFCLTWLLSKIPFVNHYLVHM